MRKLWSSQFLQNINVRGHLRDLVFILSRKLLT